MSRGDLGRHRAYVTAASASPVPEHPPLPVIDLEAATGILSGRFSGRFGKGARCPMAHNSMTKIDPFG